MPGVSPTTCREMIMHDYRTAIATLLTTLVWAGCASAPPVRQDCTKYEVQRRGHSVSPMEFCLQPFPGYAAKLEELSKLLFAHWEAPYGYRIGVLEGEVKVSLHVSANGEISEVRLLESVGDHSLTEAVSRCLERSCDASRLYLQPVERSFDTIVTFRYPKWRVLGVEESSLKAGQMQD